MRKFKCTGIRMSDENMQNDLKNEVLEAAHTMAYILPLQRKDKIMNSAVEVAKTSDQHAIDVDTDIMKFDRNSAHNRTYENKLYGRYKPKGILCFGQRKEIRSELQSFLMTSCNSDEKTIGTKIILTTAKSPSYGGNCMPSNAESSLNWKCDNALGDQNHKTKSILCILKSSEKPMSNQLENVHDNDNEDQSTIKPGTRKDNGEKAIRFAEQDTPSYNNAYNDQRTHINKRSSNCRPSYSKQIEMDTIQKLRCVSKSYCSVSAGDVCSGRGVDERIIHTLLKSNTRIINTNRNQFASQCNPSDFNSFNENVGSQPKDTGSRHQNCTRDNEKCTKEPIVETLRSGKEGNYRATTNILKDGDYEQCKDENCSGAFLVETANRQTKYRAKNEERKKCLIAKTRKGHKQRGGARSPKSNVRRRRIESSNSVSEIMSWASGTVHNGRIHHPEVGYLIHPSYFSNNHGRQTLCSYRKKCSHQPACRDIRALMAARSYMENRDHLSYRDIEAVWGVSRSTVQRKTTILKSISQSTLNKLYEQIGWNNNKTTHKTTLFKDSNKIDLIGEE